MIKRIAAAVLLLAVALLAAWQLSPWPSALRGLVLHCGIYDPEALNGEGAMANFLRTAVWSYLGTKTLDPAQLPAGFSIRRKLSGKLPPLFITAGNADPLPPHSLTLAAEAAKLGINVDSLFFPDKHTPPLQHEYEFDLDVEAGRIALHRRPRGVGG